MKFKRHFSPAEINLFDSEWELEHPKGKFLVEFHADAYNHFVCSDFPAHSHWSLVDDADGDPYTPSVHINWGKFGKYVLKMSADGKSMEGSAEGQPDNWRKAKRMRFLNNPAKVHEHDH